SLAELAQALRERLAIIRDEESRGNEAKHIARLRTVSEKIDRLQESLLQQIDPRLKHYLERRSYEKALEFLEHHEGRAPARPKQQPRRPDVISEQSRAVYGVVPLARNYPSGQDRSAALPSQCAGGSSRPALDAKNPN